MLTYCYHYNNLTYIHYEYYVIYTYNVLAYYIQLCIHLNLFIIYVSMSDLKLRDFRFSYLSFNVYPYVYPYLLVVEKHRENSNRGGINFARTIFVIVEVIKNFKSF